MEPSPELDIIFEDTHLMVLNKPAGLLSQGDHTGEDNLVDRLRLYLGRSYVGLIHRLDRNTSGLILIGKRTKSASRLSDALSRREIARDYIGVTSGTVPSDQRWTDWIEKDERENRSRILKKETSNSKKAITIAHPLAHLKWNSIDITFCAFTLESGRSHQIRAQSAHHGFPLLGDSKYGSPSTSKIIGRPALHAARITFPHPMSKDTLRFHSALPADLRSLANRDVEDSIRNWSSKR